MAESGGGESMMASPEKADLARGSLAPATLLSLVIAVLTAVASVAGLLFPRRVYPLEELRQSFLPNDVINILIGLPILLGSLWMARRGKGVGLLLWPGAIFFILYNYTVYVLAMSLNPVLILHLALVALSLYTLIVLLANLDGSRVQSRLRGKVPERLAGGVLAGMGALFFARALGMMAGLLTTHRPVAGAEIALHMTDFLFAPAWVVCGILLFRRKAFGYLTGLAMLFQAGMLFLGLILLLLVRPLLTAAPFILLDVLAVAAMGLVCWIPLVLSLRGALSSESRR